MSQWLPSLVTLCSKGPVPSSLPHSRLTHAHTPCPTQAELEAAREVSRVALGVLAWRHWMHHGEALEACFADTGATTEAQLRQQVGGQRRAYRYPPCSFPAYRHRLPLSPSPFCTPAPLPSYPACPSGRAAGGRP